MKNNNYKQTEIGEIPEDWDIATIKEVVASANTGLDAIRRAPIVSYDTGIKCLRIQDVSQNKEFENWGFCTVTENNYDKFQLLTGDILIARTGASVGVNMLINENLKSVFNNGLIRIRSNDKILPQFLFYDFQSPFFIHHIDSISQGTSTQPNIQINTLLSFRIPLPSIFEQQQIANFLSSLDDKIELNRKMNKTLEETGKALFKRWFVDFEFPNGDGNPYKSSGGKMVDSELGKIPKGWEVKKLGDLTSIDRGISYKGKYLSDKGQPMLNLGSFDLDGSLKLDALKYYTGDFKSSNTVKPGDIIIANTDMTQNRTILGSACIVPNLFDDGRILFTHHVYGIRIKENVPPNYLYRVLKYDDFKNRAIGYATGTTVLFLPKEAILNYQIALPLELVLNKFNDIYKEIIRKQEFNNNENQFLSQIRDSILPRLMSGKLRVS